MGLNLKKVGETASTFEALPEDRYNVAVTEAEITTSKNNKTMLQVTFTVLDDPYKNRKLWKNFVVDESPGNEKALVFFYSFLGALKSKLIDNEDVDIQSIPKAIIGKKCNVYAVPAKTNTGKDTNNVSSFKPIEIIKEKKSAIFA